MRVVKHELFEKYKHLKLIDVHNHDADYYKETDALTIWQKYHIDKTVLFGHISEPAAIESDRLAFEAYKAYPKKLYPFFSGFPMYVKDALTTVKHNLEKGYFGVGETVAASTYSYLTSKLQWKAQHPMDGILPDIYRLCAQYKAPILLHIDPPFGEVITKLEEALSLYPDTTFIFAHANVYNPPSNLLKLLQKHSNLMIDFFAGFTAYDPTNEYTLESYIPLIQQYPKQFLLSTDSATAQNLNYEKAINAMYEVIDLCHDDYIANRIANQNFTELIEQQPITATQLTLLQEYLSNYSNETVQTERLNKRMANELLIKYNLI